MFMDLFGHVHSDGDTNMCQQGRDLVAPFLALEDVTDQDLKRYFLSSNKFGTFSIELSDQRINSIFIAVPSGWSGWKLVCGRGSYHVAYRLLHR